MSTGQPNTLSAVLAGLPAEVRERFREISFRANSWGRKPTVVVIERIDPLTAAGGWVPELVELAGGVNLFGEAGRESLPLPFEELCREDPDVIMIDRPRQELPSLASRLGWENLRAVRNGRVTLADGNTYFNRPGPLFIESLEILAEAIQPAAFAFGHAGVELL